MLRSWESLLRGETRNTETPGLVPRRCLVGCGVGVELARGSCPGGERRSLGRLASRRRHLSIDRRTAADQLPRHAHGHRRLARGLATFDQVKEALVN